MSKEITSNKEYIQRLGDIKKRIRSSQLKAVLRVNQELLSLYWFIGEALATKQTEWGDKFINNLARDLKIDFPDTTGYSKTNLKSMRRWYSFYNEHSTIGQQAVDQLKLGADSTIMQQAITQIPDNVKNINGQQAVDLTLNNLLICIPWGHHTLILTKVKDPEEAVFYIIKTIQNGWSRSVLQLQIENDLYNRQGKALTNFNLTLPSPQSDYAQGLIKSSYNFEHLTLAEDVRELEIEKALVKHMSKFLTELGKGFAYIGRQVNLNIGGDDFFIDLLFFNTELNCYVVFELKIGDFKPGYAAQLNLYINGVNAQYKREHHAPTIGVLLCKTPNKTVIEYSIKNIDAPLGVSDYLIRRAVPEELKTGLPTVKELELELEKEIEVVKNPLDEKMAKLKEIINKNNADEVQIEKNKEAITEITNKVFFPMIDKIQNLNKKNKLDDLYRKIEYRYICGDRILEGRKGFRDTLNKAQNLPEKMEFNMQYKGFKKAGVNAFDNNLDIVFTYEKYKYTIEGRFSDEKITELLYHQYPNESELNSIAELIIEKLVDKITYNAQRNIDNLV